MPGLIVLAIHLAQVEPIPERLPPIERCSGEEGFEEFRGRLKDVVARRHSRALLAMLSEGVEVNFGGDRGPAQFALNWTLNEPTGSQVWSELDEALSQGCAPSGDALVAPSFVTQFPHQLDAFETVIIPPGTKLRTARSEGSAKKGSLDWHLASIVDDAEGDWLEVRLVDGRRGFVRRDQTVDPLDYRLLFAKRDGKWEIVAFVAGD